MEERPVPQSTIPGEKTSATQPFPLKPPPLSRVEFTEDEIYNETPEHAAFCRDLFDRNQMKIGSLYTPLGLEGNVLMFPSTLGGGSWGGVSADPSLGYLFTNVNNLGQWGHMEDHRSGDGRGHLQTNISIRRRMLASGTVTHESHARIRRSANSWRSIHGRAISRGEHRSEPFPRSKKRESKYRRA